MIQPLVSVCIPTFNGALYLQEALDSISKQSYANLEIIISDDASIDATLEIANQFIIQTSFPVYIYHHKPSGIGANWNNCLKYANGKYIKFLFQDDLLKSDCISKMVDVLEKNLDAAMVASKRNFIVEGEMTKKISDWIKNHKNLQSQFDDGNKISYLDKNLFKREDFLKSHLNKIGEPSATMFRKSVLTKVGYFNEDLRQVLDLVFCYRILKIYQILIINEPLVEFRIHGLQTTNQNRRVVHNDNYLYQKILFNEFFHLLHPEVQRRLHAKHSLLARIKTKVKILYNSIFGKNNLSL